ncbi:MAG: IS200/IS605 family element transposase accessory protein TnpB [Thaumarchaeota archaeon]|nr:IS200/IS605 family element transposase accessory protein TnpB [Nitrososphaerota archaeon]
MTYNAVHYGEENGISNRKGMKRFYQSLKGINLPSYYKVGAITRACAVLKSRNKSEKRGEKVRMMKHPKPLKSMVCILSGFIITAKGRLFIPLRRDKYVDVQLNRYISAKLGGQGRKIRSLTITSSLLSFCYSEEVETAPVKTVYGVDRNEKNLSFGNEGGVVQIDMSKIVRIKQTTREILASFKRNDVRIRRKLARKYWRRSNNRTNQILHATTNFMVETAARNGAALAFEDLKDINKMYRKGKGSGKKGAYYRFRLNSWPHWKARQMVEYKATWKGVPIISLTKSETRGSSSTCSTCGEKLRKPVKSDVEHTRMLWSETCRKWIDRDVNAVLNLSERGLARFVSSLPQPDEKSLATSIFSSEAGEKGLTGEAVKGERENTPNPQSRCQQVNTRTCPEELAEPRAEILLRCFAE